MNTKTASKIKIGNMHVHLIPSKKFKTITMELKFRAPLNRDTITKRALLPLILKKGSKHYPSDVHMQEKLDDLYGAAFGIGGYKAGAAHIVNMQLAFANGKFVNDEAALLHEAVAFINEVIAHPKLADGRFSDEIVEREKENLRRHLHSMTDDKMNYANLRLMDEMCPEEPIHVHPNGYEADLDDLDGTNLSAYYRQMLTQDAVDFFIVGDFDEQLVEKALTDQLADLNALIQGNESFPKVEREPVCDVSLREVVERQSLKQAKLHIGYRTQTTFQNADFAAVMVGVMILGGHSGSKLFINVREKNSLSYYVASAWDYLSDVMVVYSGIAPADYEKARGIIEQQVQAMKQGEITDTELNDAKSLIVSQFRSMMDDANGMIDLHYQQKLSSVQRTPEDIMQQIHLVTKEEVIQSANKLKEDTVFLLTEKEGN